MNQSRKKPKNVQTQICFTADILIRHFVFLNRNSIYDIKKQNGIRHFSPEPEKAFSTSSFTYGHGSTQLRYERLHIKIERFDLLPTICGETGVPASILIY